MITTSPQMPSSSWLQAGKLVLNHLPAVAESERIAWRSARLELATARTHSGPERPCDVTFVTFVTCRSAFLRSDFHDEYDSKHG